MTVVAAGLATAACSADDAVPPAAASGDASTSSAAAETLLEPATFAAAVAEERTFVHVPDEGSTPLAVYCRSGRMSAIAVPALRDLGYTDAVELAGGTRAWASAG